MARQVEKTPAQVLADYRIRKAEQFMADVTVMGATLNPADRALIRDAIERTIRDVVSDMTIHGSHGE